jgi:hypothetical protein
MRYLAIYMTVLGLLFATACAQRALIQPSYVHAENIEFVYMVEQEDQKDSRIKKCDILPDNSVNCTTEFDLD